MAVIVGVPLPLSNGTGIVRQHRVGGVFSTFAQVKRRIVLEGVSRASTPEHRQRLGASADSHASASPLVSYIIKTTCRTRSGRNDARCNGCRGIRRTRAPRSHQTDSVTLAGRSVQG
jgi:hypothetical protein